MQSIAREILAYLAENPDASDTAEGIADWWLPAGATTPPRAGIEQVLAELTATGWLSESRGRDARLRYRLAPQRAAALAALLQDPGEGV